jgi:hypothetical protein
MKPFTGSYDAEKSKTVVSDSANFMWHGMTAHLWYHRTISELSTIVREIEKLIRDKEELVESAEKLIDNFDWSHMMSDDFKPSKTQRDRETAFNQLVSDSPEDVRLTIYKLFINAYVHFDVNGKNPISYEKFIQGIKI